MRTGIATRQGVPTQDPLNDFESEVTIVYTDPIPAPASWPVTQAPTHAIDTTSRVISFVLGFALASLIAWLGTISSDDVAATGNRPPVASVGTRVVAAATEETEEKQAAQPVPVSSTASAAIAAPAILPTAPPPHTPPPSPSKTAEPAAAASNVAPVRTPRPVPSGYRGGLALTSTPAGAQVVLNGKVVGETPVVLNDLPVGSRAIVVRRDGYSPWSASVRVVANQRTTVKATLKPQSGS